MKKKTDGGANAIRGFVVQTLIALLKNLNLDQSRTFAWTHVTLEPELTTEKVDLLWHLEKGGARAIQVKSTKGSFEAWELKKWAEELLKWDDVPGVTYELCLVEEEPNAKIDKIKEIRLKDEPSRVCKIVRLKLDIDALRAQAVYLLSRFIEEVLGHKKILQNSCLSLVCRLESDLNDHAIRQESIDRDRLIRLIQNWCNSVTPRELPVVRVYLSAPDDVADAAAAALEAAVDSFNRLDSEVEGLKLETVDWDTVTSKQKWGPEASKVGNGEPAPLFLAVLSRRLGDVGGRPGTAGRAELDLAIKRWKNASASTIAFLFDEDASDGLRKGEELRKRAEVADFEEELVRKQHHVRLLRYRSRFDESLGSNIRDYLRSIARKMRPAAPVVAAAQVVTSIVKPGGHPAAVEHYLQRLSDDTGYLQLIGLGRAENRRLSIETAFVPMQVVFDDRDDQFPRGRHRDVDAPRRNCVSLDEVFRYALNAHRRGVVLLGEPGAGKTTAARQLAWSLASAKRSAEDFGLPAGTLPVMLRLREFPAALAKSKKVLSDFLCRATQCQEADAAVRSPGRQLLNSQHLLWIFDGLDEVFDSSLRKRLAECLRAIVVARPRDYFLVTSRHHGYYDQDVPLGERFLKFDVDLLGDDDMRRFVTQWYAAMADSEVTKDRAALKVNKQAKANALADKLSRLDVSVQRLRDLARNPLMLTLLCLIYDEREDLPENRADLYAECIKVLLEHWRRQLVGTQRFDQDTATDVLAQLAWELQGVRRTLEAPLDELQKTAAQLLRLGNVPHGLGTDGKDFLELMLGRIGILALSGGVKAQCGFLHRTFQESLAARHARENGKAREMAEAAASAQDDWWHETVLVSLREKNYCQQFFAEMLRAGIAEKLPDFADRCLNEAKYFDHEPFLEALNDPNTPPDRVAAVLRMLRGKSDRIPELGEVVRQVVGQRFRGADEIGKQIRGYAQEILAHSGGTLPDEPTGQVRVDSRTGITWVAISPGEFLMGGDQGRDERPIHRVKITQGFWLAKYPVTNQQYGLFLDSLKGKIERPEYWDDRRFNQPEQPVVGVSWHDAQQYCEWAGCRLPTEAEWEYCCRATSQGEYCFGDDRRMLGEYGWFRENSGGQTQPVGTKRANTWGLHDMHGNVWEWCQDWYSSDFYKESAVEDPQGPLRASSRVIRGGGWRNVAAYCRSAYRSWIGPVFRISSLGFRAALSSEPVQVRSQPRKPRRGRRR